MEYDIESMVDVLMVDPRVAIAWTEGDEDYISEIAFRRFGAEATYHILTYMFG